MDDWAWVQLRPGSLSASSCQPDRCSAFWRARVVSDVSARETEGPRTARRRAPALRTAPGASRDAVEMAREGVPINVIQRQLGHCNLGVTSVYLQGIDSAEIVDIVHGRAAPMIPATTALV